MFTRSQFLSCSGFLGFLKVIKGTWQEMLPGTWSVLIDGSGSVVLLQAVGQMTACGSSPVLSCQPCRDHWLPRPMDWGNAEGEGDCTAGTPCSAALTPSSPISFRRVMVQGRSVQQRAGKRSWPAGPQRCFCAQNHYKILLFVLVFAGFVSHTQAELGWCDMEGTQAQCPRPFLEIPSKLQ